MTNFEDNFLYNINNARKHHNSNFLEPIQGQCENVVAYD